LKQSVVVEKNLYKDWSDPIEGVVVKVPARVACKRFAIKDNGISDPCEPSIDDRKKSFTAFFCLRTLWVVTGVLNRGLIQYADGRNAKCHSDLQYFSHVRTLSSVA